MNIEPLYPYQQDNARRIIELLSTSGAAVDRSEMGTGKTWTAAVVARESGLVPVVCCPKSTISNWEDVFDQCGVCQPYLITNYEKLRLGKHPHMYIPRGRPCGSVATMHTNQGWRRDPKLLIIFDEAHRLRDRKSQQTKMLIRARAAGHKILLLSATLIQTPLDISAIGYALGLFDKPSAWWPYARKFGAFLNLRGYYDCSASPDHLVRLNAELDGKGVRTRIEDLGYDLPCTNSVELIDVPCTSLRSIYEKLQKEAAESGNEKAYDAAALVARGRAREAAEFAKIPWFIQEAESLVKEGYSVVVFVNYTQTLREMVNRMEKCPSVIHGDQLDMHRRDAIQQFQTNSTKILVANIKAGGIGLSLHDTEGNHPRVALISPPESAIDLLQCLGRIRRVGMASPATNRIVYATDSVEHRVFQKVKTKLNHLATLNDGDLEYEL